MVAANSLNTQYPVHCKQLILSIVFLCSARFQHNNFHILSHFVFLISRLLILKQILKLNVEPTFFFQDSSWRLSNRWHYCIYKAKTPSLIFLISDNSCEINRTHSIVFQNIAFIASSDKIRSSNSFWWEGAIDSMLINPFMNGFL